MKKWILSPIVLLVTITVQSQWQTTGNAGMGYGNFIGTTDLGPLQFRVNNYPAGFINPLSNNLAYGPFALYTNPVGNPPTQPGSVNANTAIGINTLRYTSSGGWNTAVGYSVLINNTSGSGNTGTGKSALSGNNTGGENTAIGSQALMRNTTGSYNVAIGSNAMNSYMNVSNYNTVVGASSGNFSFLGWNNVLLGANCNVNINDRYNCIAVGQDITLTGNNQARIGNLSTNSIGGYANWSNFSDGRYKKDIQKLATGLKFIMKLQPVTYHLDLTGLQKKLNEGQDKPVNEFTQKAIQEKENILFSGFIAQDVENAAKETGYDFSGVDKPQDKNDFYALRYAEFVVPLVKGMQEQQQMIEELRTKNAMLEQRLGDLEKKIGTVPLSRTTESLSVWPNPSKGELLVTINATQRSSGNIMLINGKGTLLKKQTVSLQPGNNIINVSTSSFVSGSYFLTAEWNNGQTQKTAQVIKE